MSVLSVTNTLVDGEVVDATKFNTNYTTDIVGYVNNRNSGSSTWDAFYVTDATNVPIIANNSTGTQNIARFQDNGTNVLQILDGGIINMPYQDFAYAVPIVQDALQDDIRAVTITSVTSQTQSSMNSSGKFTCVQPGKYLIIGNIIYTATLGTGNFELRIYKNGVSFSRKVASSSTTTATLHVFDILSAVVGDYFELYIVNSANENVIAGPGKLYIHKLS